MKITINESSKEVQLYCPEIPIHISSKAKGNPIKVCSIVFKIHNKYPWVKELILTKNEKMALLKRNGEDYCVNKICEAILTGVDYNVEII